MDGHFGELIRVCEEGVSELGDSVWVVPDETFDLSQWRQLLGRRFSRI